MKLVVTVLSALAAAAATAPRLSKSDILNLYRQPMKVIESKPSPHINGGHEAIPYSIPYSALLIISSRDESWYCGGALISRNYVLSAATCMHDDTWVIYTYLGIQKYLGNEDTELLAITGYYTNHENYTSSSVFNDIALVRLPQTIDYTDAIQPIPLPKDPTLHFAGSLATMSGWGVNASQYWDFPDTLNYLMLGVLTNEACESYFGPLSSTILCTGPVEEAGICGGDSGNPLVAEGVLIGLAAFTGPGCLGQPIGFTRITKYLDWIKYNSDVEI